MKNSVKHGIGNSAIQPFIYFDMKAIILSRVSTLLQDLQEQTEDLINIATKEYGYKRNQLILIENKESAIKRDEEHRLGLVEMKETILNDPEINCVFCREVSRVGRRYDVLQSIKSFLVTNRIQLVVCGNPRIELLDRDGRITMLGGIMFEIACQRAIEEMEEKKQRFKQGRARSIKEGKAAQCRVGYGYYIDKNGYVKVNDAEAAVVNRLFDVYANTDISTIALYRKLVEDGTWNRLSSDITGGNKVRALLSNYRYSGRNHKNKAHNEIHYKAIVTEDLQDKAIAKLHRMKQQPKYITKYVYYAKSLVRCTCGHIMQAEISTMCYWCPFCGKRHSINNLDWLAWNSAAQLKLTADTTSQRETVERYTKDITVNDNKIEVMKKRLDELEEREEDIAEYCLAITNKERRERFRAKKLEEVNTERKQVEKSILKVQEQTRQMRQYLTSLQEPVTDGTGIVPVLEITDDEKRKEIINQCIEEIKLDTIDDTHVHITIVPKATIANQYWFDYFYDKTVKNNPKTMEHHTEYDTYADITKDIVAGRRLTKKYVKQRIHESKINARATAQR